VPGVVCFLLLPLLKKPLHQSGIQQHSSTYRGMTSDSFNLPISFANKSKQWAGLWVVKEIGSSGNTRRLMTKAQLATAFATLSTAALLLHDFNRTADLCLSDLNFLNYLKISRTD
jgi:hypothetical protein